MTDPIPPDGTPAIELTDERLIEIRDALQNPFISRPYTTRWHWLNVFNELIAARKEIKRLNGELTSMAATTKETVRTFIKALVSANLKAAGSLANNLCHDHRDKQVGKPCLACEIEKLEKEIDRLTRVTTQYEECMHLSMPTICLAHWLSARMPATAGMCYLCEIERLTARIAELGKGRDEEKEQ